MKATKEHVKRVAELYGVEIKEYRPKKNIVLATREYGLPFVSKIMSAGLEGVQKKNIPLEIADEYAEAEDKIAKRQYKHFRLSQQHFANFGYLSNADIKEDKCLNEILNKDKFNE